VYLGIGVAAYLAISEIVKGRTPPGFTQSLAYHPDVRRQVGEMSVDLEAARLLTHYAAWLSGTQGPTPTTLSALYRAKYFVGEAVTRITRTAMTLGGAHALFKTSPLERFFREQSLPYSSRLAISACRRSACSSWASTPATCYRR